VLRSLLPTATRCRPGCSPSPRARCATRASRSEANPNPNPNPDPDPDPDPNPDPDPDPDLHPTPNQVRDLRQSKLRLDSSLESLVDRSRFEAPEPRPSRAKAAHLLKAASRGANLSNLVKPRQMPVSPRGPGGTLGGTPGGGGDHLQRAADAAHMAPAGPSLDARLGSPELRRLDTQLSAGSTAQAALG
jgi:hypothetical protein